MQADNQVLKQELADLDVELTGKRDALTLLKHERDVLRAEKHERKQSRGVVSSEELLLDYEKRRQHILAQKEELDQLRARHAMLLGKTSSVKATAVTIAGF
jgi:tRNA A37 threonylcarbamoyladenosine dehydratase